MRPKTQDMTTGRPLRLIVLFALPLMLGNVFQQLYTVVDTMVVGKALGVRALAAVGAADWPNWMMLGIVQGLAQGFAILMAQAFGARDNEGLRGAVGGAAVLSCLCAAVLTAAGQLAAPGILRGLHTPADIWDGAILYLRIMYGGIPVVLGYNLLASILRSLGDSRTPLLAMVVASLTNIGLDLLFVLTFRWGIAGAAAATLLAQCVSSVLCLVRLRHIAVLRLTPRHLRPPAALCGRLFALGLPMAFQNGLIGVGGMIIQSVVNGFGVTFIAGMTATNKLYGILEIAALSYGYAMTTYVGQNRGAGDLGRIRAGVRAAVGLGTLTSVGIAAVMLAFGRPILGQFISGTPQEVRQTLSIAYTYLATMSVFLPILYLLHVVRAAVQGAGNTVLPMLSGFAEFAMRTVATFTLPGLLGPQGIFLAEIAAWVGADIILVVSYFVVVRHLAMSGGMRPPFTDRA